MCYSGLCPLMCWRPPRLETPKISLSIFCQCLSPHNENSFSLYLNRISWISVFPFLAFHWEEFVSAFFVSSHQEFIHTNKIPTADSGWTVLALSHFPHLKPASALNHLSSPLLNWLYEWPVLDTSLQMQYCQCWVKTSTFALTAVPFLLHLWIPFGYFAVEVVLQDLLVFCAKLLSSCWFPSRYWCMGLVLCRCRIWSLPLLNVIRFLLDHFYIQSSTKIWCISHASHSCIVYALCPII